MLPALPSPFVAQFAHARGRWICASCLRVTFPRNSWDSRACAVALERRA